MAFTRPTLETLIRRARSDIETRITGAVASLRNSFESAIARVVAGVGHGLHGHIVWLSRQIFPDTSEDEFIERWAAIWNLTRNAATYANGQITMTGTDTTVCPAGTEWTDQNGLLYTQDDDVTIASGTGVVTVTAQTAGDESNKEVGETVSLVSPVSGIDSDATVSGDGITDGDDREEDEDLQDRLLERMGDPPKGGGPGDYVLWAREVAGVTRVWEVPKIDGPGTVGIYFVMDNKSATIIPDSGEVQTVQDHLDSNAPVTADVRVYAPTEIDVDVTFTSLTPDTAAVQAAIEAELADFILRVTDDIAIVTGSSTWLTLYLSQLNEAISVATGETDHVISAPAADTTYTIGQIPALGTVTFPP